MSPPPDPLGARTLSQKAFDTVATLFHGVSGIRLGAHKHALVASRLQRLAQEAGEDDVDAYVERVARGHAPHDEMVRLIDRLTTNETYFFREPQHFEHLAGRVAAAAGQRDFRVWSAASSSGEEAYSIAMVLAEGRGRQDWEVIGTDLSTAMVDTAQRALYPLERARMVPQAQLKRWCLKGQGRQEGKLMVSRELRAHVRFLQANLMQPLPPELPMFDVVFLRNVLIYFENDAKAHIVRNVISRLKPDGVLYTGHAESLTALGLPLRTAGAAIHAHA